MIVSEIERKESVITGKRGPNTIYNVPLKLLTKFWMDGYLKYFGIEHDIEDNCECQRTTGL